MRDLLSSERGVFCLLVLVAATVLVALHQLTGADWITLMKWLIPAYVLAKTATGALDRTVAQDPTGESK